MIIFNESVRAYKLVSLLSVVGEYPIASLGLLGNERGYKRLIREMSAKQTYRNSKTGEEVTCTALSILRKSHHTIRLKLKALPLMEWVGGAEYWQEAWGKNHWSGNESSIERHHRVAEVVAMMQRANIEYRPWKMPKLQTEKYLPDLITDSSFYISKEFKLKEQDDAKQIGFTRFTGVMASPAECITVYNARSSVMKWGKKGESKAKGNIRKYIKSSCRNGEIQKMILMSDNFDTAIATVLQTEKDEEKEIQYQKYKRKHSYSLHNSMTSLYKSVYYVPLNEFGMKLLQLLSIPNNREEVLNLFYDEEELSYGNGSSIYDAYRGGRRIVSFLDGDIARLKMFKDAIEYHKKRGEHYDYAVLCFPEQKEYLKRYLGEDINYPTTNIDDVLHDLRDNNESEEEYE